MPDTLACASWLVYATRAGSDDAARIRDVVLLIKRDRVDAKTHRLYADIAVERMLARERAQLDTLFDADALLVPIPGSGLTRPNTVWPARTLCDCLRRAGLGGSVRTLLQRAIAVPKSAGNQNRPTLDQHHASFAVQGALGNPSQIVLVDDVVTSGTTLMAGARRLEEASPRVPITAFALARVHSAGDPASLFGFEVDEISVIGQRCRRRPR